MVKVSIIVPVYNVEKYLKKCLESLVNQTLKDIEIIVVNDGSPDNSQKIIDEYKRKYSNIKSFIKTNGGLSDARNFGIEKAIGEYIAFVDSDDYVQLDMFKTMYSKAKEKDYDVVVCDVNYVYEKNSKQVSSLIENDITSKQEIKEHMINIYPAVWNKIFKKELFDKGIRFKKSVWYEDVEFLYRLFPYINSIGTVKKSLINYVQRDGAITRTFDKRLYNYIDNWNGIIEFYKKNNFYEEYYNEIEYCYVRYLFATFIKGAKNFPKKEYKQAVDIAVNNVNEHFPNYKQNKYLKKSLKGLYLKHFNKFIAKILYWGRK